MSANSKTTPKDIPKPTDNAPFKPPKCGAIKGNVTVPGPRIDVGEQLLVILKELRDLRATVEELMEDGDTEEYDDASQDAED